MIIRAFPLLGSRELLRRLGVTLAVLTVIRFGQTAPLPSFRAAAVASAGAGGSAAAAAAIAAATGGGSMEAALEGGLGRHAAASEAALLDLGGGDGGGGDPPTGAVSLLSLGIGPTINASWLFSIVTLLRLPKEWGVDPFKGARRLLTALRSGNRDDVAAYGLIVNLTAAAFAALAGWRTAAALAPFVRPPCPPGFTGEAAALLATGALITRWLTSMVDEHGLGDGVSLLIAMAVVSGYARSLRGFGAALSGAGWSAAATVAAGSAVAACSLAIVSAAVWLTQVETRLPLVVYARRRVPALRGGVAAPRPGPPTRPGARRARRRRRRASRRPPSTRRSRPRPRRRRLRPRRPGRPRRPRRPASAPRRSSWARSTRPTSPSASPRARWAPC